MSYSNKKAKIIQDWIKLHPNVVTKYTVEDTGTEKASGRYEHRLELADHCAINGHANMIQDPSAESVLWALHNLLEIEEDELPF